MEIGSLAVQSENLSVMGLDGSRAGVGGGGRWGKARRGEDPRHDRCSLIQSDLQQLHRASDKEINKEIKEDEALIWKRLCSALTPLHPPNPERQTVKQVACSISIHPVSPCIYLMEELASAPPLSIL